MKREVPDGWVVANPRRWDELKRAESTLQSLLERIGSADVDDTFTTGDLLDMLGVDFPTTPPVDSIYSDPKVRESIRQHLESRQ